MPSLHVGLKYQGKSRKLSWLCLVALSAGHREGTGVNSPPFLSFHLSLVLGPFPESLENQKGRGGGLVAGLFFPPDRNSGLSTEVVRTFLQ